MLAERLAVRYRSATGTPLISVTQVLTITGRIDRTWFTPEAAERGQIVHDLTERYDRGESFDVRDDLVGYLDAYARFVATVRPVYSGSEVKVTSDRLKVGGRIDRICLNLFGRPALLDFKTSLPYPWHGQQLAFYNLLCPVGARWACYLGRDGRYKLRQYDDPDDHRRNMYDLAKVRGTVHAEGDYWTIDMR